MKIAMHKTIEVRQFLSKSFPYASQCFAQDTVNIDEVNDEFLANWLQRYFGYQHIASEIHIKFNMSKLAQVC